MLNYGIRSSAHSFAAGSLAGLVLRFRGRLADAGAGDEQAWRQVGRLEGLVHVAGLDQRQVHAQVEGLRHPLLRGLGVDVEDVVLGLERQVQVALAHVGAQLSSS